MSAVSRPATYVVAALLSLLVGCGEAGEVTAAGAGSDGDPAWPTQLEMTDFPCPTPPPVPRESESVLPGFFGNVTWVAAKPGLDLLADAKETQPAAGEIPAFLDLAARGSGVADTLGIEAEVLTADATVIGFAQDELDRGAELRISYRSRSFDTKVSFVVTMRPDGEAFVIGACPGQIQQWADAVVDAGLADTHADAIRLVTDAGDPAAAFAGLADLQPFRPPPEPTPEWPDRDPLERHWHTAPLEALAQVTPVLFDLTLPANWRDAPFLVCSRTATAWSPCAKAYAGTTISGLAGYVEGVGDVEFWLVLPESPYTPIAELGRVTGPDLQRTQRVVITDSSGSELTGDNWKERLDAGAITVTAEALADDG